jgi:hypothetical protein
MRLKDARTKSLRLIDRVSALRSTSSGAAKLHEAQNLSENEGNSGLNRLAGSPLPDCSHRLLRVA